MEISPRSHIRATNPAFDYPRFNQYQISIRFYDFRIVNSILLIKTLLSKLTVIFPILQKWQVRSMK